uniref:Ig-like domain-containing protein n=1 Tax=Plectus sambesii TaxID=2011161 RepID=A0A914X2C9_9BILA
MARVIVIRGDSYQGAPGSTIVHKSGIGVRKATARYYSPSVLQYDHDEPGIGPFYRSPGRRANYRAIEYNERSRSPPEIISRLEDQWQGFGENVRLRCSFKGSPTPTVTWYKNQQPIREDMRIMMSCESGVAQLSIYGTRTEDNGLYTCRVENNIGMRETSCQVYIADTKPLSSPGKKVLTDYRSYRLLYPSMGLMQWERF